MGDVASDRTVTLQPTNRRLLRIVLAIGLPPFLPQLVQLGVTGGLDNLINVSGSNSGAFVIFPANALIGVGWAVGGFLYWWYGGRAGNLLVWMVALTVAGGAAGYADALFRPTPGVIGAAYGFVVGFVDWCLLKSLPLGKARMAQRRDDARPVDRAARFLSWQTGRTIVAVGLPPALPYVVILAFAGPIMSDLTTEPYEIVLYSHVAFAMIPVAWILGGFMVCRGFDRRWGPLLWLGLFAIIGTMLGVSVMGISRDYQQYAVVIGAVAGMLIWLTLRATGRWHDRKPGSLFAWIVAGALVSVAGVLVWLGLPRITYFFLWMFPAVGAVGGAATGLMMWGLLRWAR